MIYNYKDIIDFSENLVNVNNYIISGEKLVINKLEDSIIEIFGQIKKKLLPFFNREYIMK